MHRGWRFLAMMLVGGTTVSCTRGTTASFAPTPGAVEEIAQLMLVLDSAQNDRDLTRFADLIADNIVFLPPDEPAVVGKPAVLEYYRTFFSAGSLSIRHHPEETIADGRMFIHRGRAKGAFRPNDASSAFPFDNKYLYVLTRSADGHLRFARVIFNAASRSSGT